MGLFKPDAPPAPDYSGLIAQSEKAADMAFQISKEQLAWAKEQYGMDKAISDQIVGKLMASQDQQTQWSEEDRARYKAEFQPLEDQLIADAESFATPQRQEMEAQRDMASVSTQFAGAREAAQRQLEGYGIDPSSTRYAALDIGTRQAEAAAKAGAGNNAVARVDAQGRALRSEAINVGRGYPGQAAVGLAQAGQAGTSAGGLNLGTTASGASTMGTAPQWQGLGSNSLGQAGNFMNMGYNNQLAQFNADQNASSGWGSVLGLGASLFMDEGGNVPEGIATEGWDVPPVVSPSQGIATDDVPARLSVGEFVIPKDVKDWKGEEFFHKLIEGSRKKKATPKQAMPQRPMPQQQMGIAA
jgi:hypothetical protein